MDKKKEPNRILFSQVPLLSGLLDSNQRPRAPQTCALPTALNPEHYLLSTDPCLSNAGAKVHRFYELTKFLGDFLRFFFILTSHTPIILNKMRIFAC